jgi:FkbM family methyltransferase
MQQVNGIYLPTGDTHFPDMIRRGPLYAGKGTYQFNKLDAALKYVRKFGTAVDVGAHVGLWTRVLADKFERVHAFEMMSTHAECLELNTVGMPNVVIHRDVALGSANGAVAIVVEEGNTGNTRVDPKPRPSTLSVAMQALDSFFPAPLTVDFIKIDVEGYEQQVAIGGAALIRRSKPVMVVEQKRDHAERYGSRAGEVIDLLKAWGARVVLTLSGDYILTWET